MPTEEKACHGHNQSLLLTLPPLGAVLFKAKEPKDVKKDAGELSNNTNKTNEEGEAQ
jgi:hypothetical protein